MIFFDSVSEPNIRPEGPTLHHFRSSTLQSEEHYLINCWKKCITDNIKIPAHRLSLPDTDNPDKSTLVITHFLEDNIFFDTIDNITTVVTNLPDPEEPEGMEKDEDFNIVKVTLTSPDEEVVCGIDEEELREDLTDLQDSSLLQSATTFAIETLQEASNSSSILSSNEVINQSRSHTSSSASISHEYFRNSLTSESSPSSTYTSLCKSIASPSNNSNTALKTVNNPSKNTAVCPDPQAQSQDKATENGEGQEIQTSLGRALATVFGKVTEDLREFDQLRQKHRHQPNSRHFCNKYMDKVAQIQTQVSRAKPDAEQSLLEW